jgi:predicted alpha/beta hydrolase
VREVPFAFAARDGYPLAGTLYLPPDDGPCDNVVVFNAGGGIACARYRHFLRFLASERLPVVAYDYRGIGQSAPSHWRGFDAGAEDWAMYDQAAAIDFASRRFAGARLASVTHSIGALIAAIAPNARQISQMVLIAPHTGYWGDYQVPWRWPMRFFWHVAMPVVVRALGRFPASSLGLGDDLPARFALEWATRSASGRVPESLVAGDVQDALLANAGRLEAPAMLVTYARDAFVSDAACCRYLAMAHRIRPIRMHLDDGDLVAGTFSHFDYFRRANAGLWGRMVEFLKTTM